MFNAIMWMLCSGAKWRDLPERYPPWKSVYHRFRYCQKHGILEQVIETLLLKAGKNRQIQPTLVGFLRRRGVIPVIPKRRTKEGQRTRNPGFDKARYRQRNVVERCLSWLKEYRRMATRSDKLSVTYSAMVRLSLTVRESLPGDHHEA